MPTRRDQLVGDRDLTKALTKEMQAAPTPRAVHQGCIDSRVPHEIIFDEGLGDVFSVRRAGNFVNTDVLGSLEFATAVAGSKVVDHSPLMRGRAGSAAG